jgi:hypothetical protein
MNDIVLVGMVYACVVGLAFPWWFKNPWLQMIHFIVWYFGAVWGAVQIAKYFA